MIALMMKTVGVQMATWNTPMMDRSGASDFHRAYIKQPAGLTQFSYSLNLFFSLFPLFSFPPFYLSSLHLPSFLFTFPLFLSSQASSRLLS